MAKRKKKVTTSGDNHIFTIEKGLDVPSMRRNNPYAEMLKKLVSKMGDGDSIFIDATYISVGGVVNFKQKFNGENKDKRLISRKIDGPVKGSRIWLKLY